SGGGISAYESKPSYQSSVTQSATKRTNPDVAYNADPNTGVYVYDSSYYGWWSVGGTSAGAPQWGALVALADQGRASSGKTNLGSTDTLNAIYNMPASDFHDITSGSNGYSAKTGYDLVTGRGTPYANSVVNYLVSYSTGTAATATHTTSTSHTTVVTRTSTRTVTNTQGTVALGDQSLLAAQTAAVLVPAQVLPAAVTPVTTSVGTSALPAIASAPASTATPSVLGRLAPTVDAAGGDSVALPVESGSDSEPVAPRPATDDNAE